MGKFYTSINLKTEDRRAIVKYLRNSGRSSWVSPGKDGFVCIFDELCEPKNVGEINRLACELTREIGCSAVSLIRHELSLVWYQFFDRGQVVGQSILTSNFMEDIGLLPPQPEEALIASEAFDLRFKHAGLKTYQTAEDLLDSLDIPLIASCLSYECLERSEFELEFDDLTDDEMYVSFDEAHLYTSLESLGWTRIGMGDEDYQVVSSGRSVTEGVLVWPGFVSAAAISSDQDMDAILSNGTEKLLNGDFKESIAEFDKVIPERQEFPHAYYAYHNRGVAWLNLNEKGNAINDLLKALKIHADCPETKSLLAKLLSENC